MDDELTSTRKIFRRFPNMIASTQTSDSPRNYQAADISNNQHRGPKEAQTQRTRGRAPDWLADASRTSRGCRRDGTVAPAARATQTPSAVSCINLSKCMMGSWQMWGTGTPPPTVCWTTVGETRNLRQNKTATLNSINNIGCVLNSLLEGLSAKKITPRVVQKVNN